MINLNQSDKRQLLFDAARALFLEQGFRKTNVAAITERANVAVGTFYKYFTSKEQIFYEVYQAENEKAKREIVVRIDTDQPPKEVVKQFLQEIIRTSEQNVILAEWYRNTEASQVLKNYNQECDVKKNSFVYRFLLDNIERWRSFGQFRRDIDVDTTLALFNVLVLLDNHKEEVGHEHYPQVLELLAEMVVDGLTASS